VLGDRCTRSFVTRGSADGGIDFVARHELGTDFSSTSIVVLGQAKCRDPQATVSPNDVARLAARLHRGWIGVFVTTATFSEQAQVELLDDRCPVILVNGQRLVQEVKQILNRDSISLQDLLEREDQWYHQNIFAVDPVTTFGYEWGVPLDLHQQTDD
jgi:restriction endonuclease Mrr